MLGGAVAAYQEKALTDYKLEAAEHYVSKEYMLAALVQGEHGSSMMRSAASV